jgi:MFS family permease
LFAWHTVRSLNPLSQLREIPVKRLPRPAWVMIVGAGVNRLAAFMQIFLVLFLTSRGLSAVAAGTMLSMYGIGGILGVLAGGLLVDRLGARPTVVSSMIVAAATVALLPTTRSSYLLLPLCLTAGVASQLFRPAASVIIAGELAAGNVVAVMGIYRFSINVASAVGPLLGGVAYHWHRSSVFLFDAATSLGFAVVAAMGLHANSKPQPSKVGAPANRGAILRDRRFCLVVAAQCGTSLIEIQYLTTLPLQLRDYGWSTGVYTFVVALNGILVIACELVVIGMLRSVAIRTKVALGCGLIGLGLALFGVSAGLALILIATVTWTVGEMLSAPGINAYPALIAPSGTSGRYYGALTAGQTAGYAAGPLVGAYIYQNHGALIWVFCGVGGLVVLAGMGVGLKKVEETAAPATAVTATPAADPVSPHPDRTSGASFDGVGIGALADSIPAGVDPPGVISPE